MLLAGPAKPHFLAPNSVIALLFVAAGACIACASSGFDGHVFRSSTVAFELRQIPEDWHRLASSSTPVGFRDDAAGSTIAVNARCGKDADDVPLQSLTQHLFLQFTERQAVSERLIQLAGREALRSELSAKLDGVPKSFIVVVLKKDGCVYDFLYISRASPSAAEAAEFDGFVQGFSTLD